MTWTMRAKVWLYRGPAAWHFITIPPKIAREIRAAADAQSAWGSIRVIVRIGESEWKTSIFPEKESRSFVLPIKAEVRKREKAVDGAAVRLTLTLQ